MPISRRAGGATLRHALHGAPTQAGTPIQAAPGAHMFGDDIEVIRTLPGADRDIGMGLTEAMVRFMARSEYAHTVEDVLARRWRALFLDAQEAARMAPLVAELLVDEGVVDPALDAFVSLTHQYSLG